MPFGWRQSCDLSRLPPIYHLELRSRFHRLAQADRAHRMSGLSDCRARGLVVRTLRLAQIIRKGSSSMVGVKRSTTSRRLPGVVARGLPCCLKRPTHHSFSRSTGWRCTGGTMGPARNSGL